MEYIVRMVLSEITVEANSEEEANDIAVDILESDARTRLDYGLNVVDFETELVEE